MGAFTYPQFIHRLSTRHKPLQATHSDTTDSKLDTYRRVCPENPLTPMVYALPRGRRGRRSEKPKALVEQATRLSVINDCNKPALHLSPMGALNSKRWRDLRLVILKRDSYLCRYCGGVATTVDHIIPRAKWPEGQDGVDDPSNLCAACLPCNSRKKDRINVIRPANKAQRREW